MITCDLTPELHAYSLRAHCCRKGMWLSARQLSDMRGGAVVALLDHITDELNKEIQPETQFTPIAETGVLVEHPESVMVW